MLYKLVYTKILYCYKNTTIMKMGLRFIVQEDFSFEAYMYFGSPLTLL